MTDLPDQIRESQLLSNWIGDKIEGLQLRADGRTRVSATLLQLCLTHHTAIIELYSSDRHASALALIRSMIDCVARSQWATHLATDDEIHGFVLGSDPPRTLKIIGALEDAGLFDHNDFTHVVEPIWPVVCDFNHGGGRIVVRHVTSDAIEPNFSAGELEEALTAANAWALLATSALADLIGDRELGNALIERAKSLRKTVHPHP